MLLHAVQMVFRATSKFISNYGSAVAHGIVGGCLIAVTGLAINQSLSDLQKESTARNDQAIKEKAAEYNKMVALELQRLNHNMERVLQILEKRQ